MDNIADLIVRAGAVLSALAVIIGAFTALVRLIDKNKKEAERNERQDRDISAMKKEQTLIIYAVRACLDGLHQKGCNGKVTLAMEKIEKYINAAQAKGYMVYLDVTEYQGKVSDIY